MSQDSWAIEFQQVTKRFGPVIAVNDISLHINHGEFFSLLGPSGCGKTTSLRLIAGFETPSAGDILIDGKPQKELPPYKRPVNTVFQSYALFPHMSVLQNIAFGLEMERASKHERQQRVHEALELVQLPGMENRKPSQLSGGQQQRVALARALVKQPKVLLLDEPLGALDLKLRKAMQLELKALQNRVGITFVYVTHDQEEALTMSDRIAVMNLGEVLQIGSPEEIYEAPSCRFVADFIGETNFISGCVDNLTDPIFLRLSGGERLPASRAESGLSPGDAAVLSIRPEKVQLLPISNGTSQSSEVIARLPGQVTQVVYLGTDTRYVVAVPGCANLIARVQNFNGTENRFQVGDQVELRWDPHHARILKDL